LVFVIWGEAVLLSCQGGPFSTVANVGIKAVKTNADISGSILTGQGFRQRPTAWWL
jgi:hypothetical protein